MSTRDLNIGEFFTTEVREYSVYANERAIPSLIDGFKPSQRKAIYATLQKAPSIPPTGFKVAQLASFCSSVTNYAHGEGSLEELITKMAQDFPGSNNLNYLQPIGTFGTRLSNIASASRYIYTNLMPSFRKIFMREDDLILEHLKDDDGDQIEPKFYLPILPNVLINGSEGMGTGFATRILSYHPDDLKDYCLAKLQDKKYDKPLVPWYRGYRGTIERLPSRQVVITGKVEKGASTKLTVIELPLDVYQDDYKKHLFKLEDQGFIKDFDDDSTANGFKFVLDVPRTTGYKDDDELIQKLKLQTRTTENFTVWLPNGRLKKFATPEEVCDAFLEFRLDKYEDRRQAIIADLLVQLELLIEKIEFIKLYLTGDNALRFSRLTKAKLEEYLTSLGMKYVDKLLEMRLYSLTQDHIDDLQAKTDGIAKQVDYYTNTDAKTMYIKDLNALNLKDDLQPRIYTVKPKGKK
jgi:DNA topoisomerase-2